MSKNNRTVDRIQAVWNILGGEKGVDDLLAGITHVVTKAVSYTVATFTITVDETLSVEDDVKKGKFEWDHSHVTSKRLPNPTGGQKSDKEVTLFFFKYVVTSKEAIVEMDNAGYKPANFWDLIGLAAKEPDLQRKYSIVALGSVYKYGDCRFVPCLGEYSSGRELSERYFDDEWNHEYRLLAVRK